MIDKFFNDIMKNVKNHPIVIENCNSEELYFKFKANNKILEEI